MPLIKAWSFRFFTSLVVLLATLVPSSKSFACVSQKDILSDESYSIEAHLIYFEPGLKEGIYLFTTPQRNPLGEPVDLLFNFGLCLSPHMQDLIEAEAFAYIVDPRQDCLFYSNWLPLHSLDENGQSLNVLQDIFMPHMTYEFHAFFDHLENAEKIQPYFDQYVHYLTSYTEYLTIAIGASLIRRSPMGKKYPGLDSSSRNAWIRSTGWTLVAAGLMDLFRPAIIEGFQIRENQHRKRWQNLNTAAVELNTAIASVSPLSLDAKVGSVDTNDSIGIDKKLQPFYVESRLRTFLEDAIKKSLQHAWSHSPGVCLPTIKANRDFTFNNSNLYSNRRFS